jgi:hypothetical protein
MKLSLREHQRALKPIRLLLPTRVELTPAVACRRLRKALCRSEMGSAYLGRQPRWTGVDVSPPRLLAKADASYRALIASAWILAYSVVGGLNGLLGHWASPGCRHEPLHVWSRAGVTLDGGACLRAPGRGEGQ